MASRPKSPTGVGEEGNEDFGFVRTFDGHIATDRFGHDTGRANRNVRVGFDEADLGGDYGATV